MAFPKTFGKRERGLTEELTRRRRDAEVGRGELGNSGSDPSRDREGAIPLEAIQSRAAAAEASSLWFSLITRLSASVLRVSASRRHFLILLSLALTACGPKPVIIVGSKNFTEQALLAEIISQHVERRLHIAVGRKFNLGGTLLAHGALTTGGIDLYPEYSGTALTAVLKQQPRNDPAAVLEQVRREYERQWRLRWLAPLGFNNTFAMMVRGEDVRKGIRTLSQAASARAWRLGAGYEFKQRPDGLAGLLRAYGLRTPGDAVTMDLGLLYAALKSRKVDMIAANSTDGLASVLDVAMLEDDRRYFPPYECAVVVREETLSRVAGLEQALGELSGKLPDAAMRRLNFAVDGEHRPPAQVAAAFLDATFGRQR